MQDVSVILIKAIKPNNEKTIYNNINNNFNRATYWAEAKKASYPWY